MSSAISFHYQRSFSGSDDDVEDGEAEDDDMGTEAAFDQHPADPCAPIDFTFLRPEDPSVLRVRNGFKAAATLPVARYFISHLIFMR